MTITTRTLALSATALLVVGAALGLALGGPLFAGGVAVAGALMVINLAIWRLAVGRMIRQALGEGGNLPLIAVAMGAKMLLLFGGLFVLIQGFPPLSVLLGSSVVVAAVMIFAVVGTFTELQLREGC